jgi:hypothetical protein
MKVLIGAAVVAAAFAFGTPAAVAATATPQAKSAVVGTSDATDFSARRYYRRYGYRPYYRPYPYYYGRPAYYRPYPYYAPAPFPFGFGFGPFWW